MRTSPVNVDCTSFMVIVLNRSTHKSRVILETPLCKGGSPCTAVPLPGLSARLDSLANPPLFKKCSFWPSAAHTPAGRCFLLSALRSCLLLAFFDLLFGFFTYFDYYLHLLQYGGFVIHPIHIGIILILEEVRGSSQGDVVVNFH